MQRTPSRHLGLALAIAAAIGCAHPGRSSRPRGSVYRARIVTLGAAPAASVPRAAVKTPSRAPHPAVLYLDGSGCRSVVHLMHLLDAAVQHGYAVVALEKPGVRAGDTGETCSSEFVENDTRERREQDARAAIAALGDALPGWDRRLVVVAASEATTFAPALARGVPEVRGLVLLGGGGWTQARELAAAQEDRLRVAGATERERLAAGDQLRQQLASIERDPGSRATWLGHSHRRWASYLRVEPLPDLLALDLPIYMANGIRDAMVPIASARSVSAAFSAAHKTNLTSREYEGLDHRWNDPAGTSHFPEVARDLLEWAVGVLPRSP